MSLDLNTNVFHVHAVLDMLQEYNKPFTLGELKDLIDSKFGMNSVFGSCSMSGMKSSEAITFLMNRQKIVEKENGIFVLNTGNPCNH